MSEFWKEGEANESRLLFLFRSWVWRGSPGASRMGYHSLQGKIILIKFSNHFLIIGRWNGDIIIAASLLNAIILPVINASSCIVDLVLRQNVASHNVYVTKRNCY